MSNSLTQNALLATAQWRVKRPQQSPPSGHKSDMR